LTRVSATLRKAVQDRAHGHCEFCRLAQWQARLSFWVDHVIARKHGGHTTLENLAFACGFCNRHKGSDLTGIDPTTGKVVPLFNPRTQRWSQHFRFRAAKVIGTTPVGRATVLVLAMNHPYQVGKRLLLIEAGDFPPETQ
jgi:hypothetical protein